MGALESTFDLGYTYFIDTLEAVWFYLKLPRTIWTLVVGAVSLVVVFTPLLGMWTARGLLVLLMGVVLLNTSSPRRDADTLRLLPRA